MAKKTFKIKIEDENAIEYIEKSIKFNSELKDIENIFVLLYQTLAIDLKYKSEDLDNVLEKMCFFPCIKESDDDEIFIKNSEEFLNKITSDVGFREFMYDFYIKQMRINI